MDALNDLRISDLQIIVAAHRHRSAFRTALAFDITPDEVEAAVARVEARVGATLFSGGGGDLLPTAGGKRLLPLVEAIVDRTQRLRIDDAERLAIAAPSFLNDVLIPRFTARPNIGLRSLALPPALIRKYAPDGMFDCAVTVGMEKSLPSTWSSLEVGDLRYGLMTSPRTAALLGPTPSIEEVAALPFVSAIYVTRDGGVSPGDDRCPLAHNQRKRVHEVETIALACKVAAATDHLVYGPLPAAATLLAEGALVEVPVARWSHADAVYLACNTEVVTEDVQQWMGSVIRDAFRTTRKPEESWGTSTRPLPHVSEIVPVHPNALVPPLERGRRS